MKTLHTYLTIGHRGFRPDVLVERYSVIGITKSDAVAFKTQIRKWILCNGIEWTLQHLKKIKQLYLNWYASGGINPAWVARSSEGIPQGVFARLKVYPKSKVIKAVNIYKVFSFVNITEAQRSKFLDAVGADFPEVPPKAYELVDLGSKPALSMRTTTEPLKIQELPSQRANGTFYSWRLGKAIPWNINEIIFDSAALLRQCDPTPKGDPWFWKCMDPVGFEPVGRSEELKQVFKTNPNPGAIGALGSTQEPGGKLRVFANPHLVYQCLLEPLKLALAETLKRIKEDSCFNHEAGVANIQKALSEKKTCYSFDLSNATDLFPYALQEHWLRKTLVDENYINLLRGVCKGRYRPSESMVSSGFPTVLKWAVGQPLGAGPSFFLFSLTHHFLIRGMCIRLGLFSPLPYTILGDDVVIWDDRLADWYSQFLKEIGCKIAMDKSIVSNRLAEFAGLTITADELLVSTKHKAISENSIADYGRIYGPSVLEGVSHLPYAEKVMPILEAIPECVGGFGWNRSAESLEKRLENRDVKLVFDHLTKVKEDVPVMHPSVAGRQRLSETIGLARLKDLSYGSIAYAQDWEKRSSTYQIPSDFESKVSADFRLRNFAEASVRSDEPPPKWDMFQAQGPYCSIRTKVEVYSSPRWDSAFDYIPLKGNTAPLPRSSNDRKVGPTWWSAILSVLNRVILRKAVDSPINGGGKKKI